MSNQAQGDLRLAHSSGDTSAKTQPWHTFCPLPSPMTSSSETRMEQRGRYALRNPQEGGGQGGGGRQERASDSPCSQGDGGERSGRESEEKGPLLYCSCSTPGPQSLHAGSNFPAGSPPKQNILPNGTGCVLVPSMLSFHFLISHMPGPRCRIISCAGMRGQRISQAESCQCGQKTSPSAGGVPCRQGMLAWGSEVQLFATPFAGRRPARPRAAHVSRGPQGFLFLRTCHVLLSPPSPSARSSNRWPLHPWAARLCQWFQLSSS